MDHRRKNIVLVVVIILLIVSLVFNWHQYKQAESMNSAAYNWGLEVALGGVNRADPILNGENNTHEDTMDAVRYVSESAGQLVALSHVMHEMSIDHIIGIGMRLDEAAKVISHPNQYSAAQIEQNKQFVHTVFADFKPCWSAQNLIKIRLLDAINKIYSAMTPQERQQFYPMY